MEKKGLLARLESCIVFATKIANTKTRVFLFTMSRSSRAEGFCKKGVLRNFTKFTGKYLYQSLFVNKVPGLRPKACNFIKKDSGTGIFLWILRKFEEHIFIKNTSAGCFCMRFLTLVILHFFFLSTIQTCVKFSYVGALAAEHGFHRFYWQGLGRST